MAYNRTPPPHPRAASAVRRAFCAVLVTLLPLGGSICATRAAAAGASLAATGVITGIVTNKTTGNGLEEAKVEIPALGLSALVDHTGRYILRGVPPGEHQLTASYLGMDSQNVIVTVQAAQSVSRDFILTSPILMMDVFKVASEKEGLSAAVSQQHNADNLKTIASMDALTDLPNMNATELALRLPGVTFAEPGDEVVEQISVRGMGAGTTSITIDGGLMSSFSAENRQTRMTAFTGAMFESLELTKGQTPDRAVDSLGGSVNFKTRSPLNMREKRRVSYNVQWRAAPWFTEQIPLREAHRNHGLFNLSYQEKFAAFGSETENLAISLNGFYSENAFGFFRAVRDYQQTNNQPAYLWDYRTTDGWDNRTQRSLNAKFDYRIGPNNLFKLNVIVNNAGEPTHRRYGMRAFAGSATTTPSNTTGIVPGAFDSRITVVRAVPTSASATFNTTAPALIDQQSEFVHRDQRLRHFDIGGEHNWGALKADWALPWSRTRYRYLGRDGSLTNRIGNIPFVGPNGAPGSPTNNIVGPHGETGVGWILDRNASDLYPRFIQNGGLDFTDPKNYRPSVNGLTTASGSLDVDLIRELRGNLEYRLPIDTFTASLKTGGSIRDHNVEIYRVNRRWSYLGKDALPDDPTFLTWDQAKTHRNLPYWETARFLDAGQPKDPSLWQEDKYFYFQNRLAASHRAHEIINGYYLMTKGKMGRFGFQGGVRHEDTDTIGYLNVRAHTLTTAAQQLADPEGSAIKDFLHPARNEGRYGQNFPSLHTWYDLTPDLKLRASYSTGMARPSLANATAALSINDTLQTVSFGNPALKPQKARNWDFSAEYSFKSNTWLRLGWFHKRIDDFIIGNREIGVVPDGVNNGFEGQYSGYTILGNSNGGSAFTQGWELEFLQQFRFLPGLLKTLRLQGNFSAISAHGDYGQTGVYLKNKDVNGFIPRTGNVGLNWDYRRFGAYVSWNYTAESIRAAYNVAQPSRNRYMRSRDLFNVNTRYQLSSRGNLTLNVGVQNLFNEPQRYYRGIPDQTETFLIQGTTVTASIEGRF